MTNIILLSALKYLKRWIVIAGESVFPPSICVVDLSFFAGLTGLPRGRMWAAGLDLRIQGLHHQVDQTVALVTCSQTLKIKPSYSPHIKNNTKKKRKRLLSPNKFASTTLFH